MSESLSDQSSEVDPLSLDDVTDEHYDVEEYSCEKCDFNTSSLNSYEKHITDCKDLDPDQLEDPSDKNFECPMCNQKFAFLAYLSRHMNKHHVTDKAFHCDVCKKDFSGKRSLAMHMRVHKEKEIHQCQECPKTFKSELEFAKHMISHKGENPFECEVCHKRFALPNTLLVHTRTHTGEKPYKCSSCDRCFSTSSYLTVSNKIHTIYIVINMRMGIFICGMFCSG